MSVCQSKIINQTNNMKQEIKKEEGNLIINLSIPITTHRSNPYDPDEHSTMDNILGVIDGDEIGFAYWIDMSYSGKGDQVSSIFYNYDGSKEEFRNLCKELGLELEEYPECTSCFKSMHGSFTYSKTGIMCLDCNLKDKEK